VCGHERGCIGPGMYGSTGDRNCTLQHGI
jgi:hypothetical protein